MQRSFSRRDFLKAGAALILLKPFTGPPSIQTVRGRVPAAQLGLSLVHEHFLVDFIGADKTDKSRWNRDEVIKKVLPYLLEAKKHGVKTIMDCTPAFLGRDVILQKELSEKTGLHIITNTGYYGAVANKYLPSHAFTETAKQMAERWTNEATQGIEGTGIKPGFIKISVDGEHLSELHQKLVHAAALTHLETGLTICSHTGTAIPAFEQIELLQKMKLHPSSFVWTHAQAEKDKSLHIKAARLGAWISLDGLGWGDFENYAHSIENLKAAGVLNKVLISHDAGWYKPDEENGGDFTGYTNIFTELLPLLRKNGFQRKDIRQLLVKNPPQAFAIKVRKL